MSPVVDVQSKNTHGNLLDNVDANNVDTGETPTSVKSTTGFFDPEQTTARRWVPSAAFGTFLEKKFRRRLNTEQVNEIIGEYSPPETDACVAPLLDKSILTYIPSGRKKFIRTTGQRFSSHSTSYFKRRGTFVLFTRSSRIERKYFKRRFTNNFTAIALFAGFSKPYHYDSPS